MNPLRNIFASEYGWKVWIVRGGLNLRGFVKYSDGKSCYDSHVALRRAVQLRDRLLAQIGAPVVHSNTGFSGISETVKYVKSVAHPCFSVWLGRRHKPKMKRIYYGRERTREQALARAVQLKQEVNHAK